MEQHSRQRYKDYKFFMRRHQATVWRVCYDFARGDRPSITYAYYQQHIKPKPAPANSPSKLEGVDAEGGRGRVSTKRWVCEVCGYVYEGDALPADFVCPWCKHPASDFKLVE